jgi:hypothetical protein
MRVVIIDFQASLNYTHHSQYIYSHVNFFKSYFTSSKLTILLPIGSEIGKKQTNFPNNLLRILIPTSYFPRTSYFKVSTWFTFVLSKINKYVYSKSNLLSNLNEFTCSLISLFTLMLVKKDVILFPSACPSALRLIRLLNLLNFSTPIRVHFATPTRKENNLNNFFTNKKLYNNLNIAFSFETQEAKSKFSIRESENLFFYARQPYLGLRPKVDVSEKNLITKNIFVLGRPFDQTREDIILRSIKKLGKNQNHLNIYFNVYVTTNFNTSLKVESDLFLNYINLVSVPYNLPFLELADLIFRADVVVLPYNPETYKYLHSGLFFLVSDLNVPIITSYGCSFSNEVLEFNIGSLFKYSSDFSDSIPKILNNTFNFKTYHSFRDSENMSIYSRLGVI